MANYYTEASFIIPCSDEQAEIAIAALNQVAFDVTELGLSVVAKSKDAEFTPMEKIVRHYFFNHPDQDLENLTGELYCGFDIDEVREGLWIYTDESINTEHAAIFTQAVLKTFDLPYLVPILAAHTCSKPRLDAFGGHACVVTKDYIHWHSLEEFIDEEIEAHKEGNSE